jgi:hypothetical protein
LDVDAVVPVNGSGVKCFVVSEDAVEVFMLWIVLMRM